MVVFTLPKRNGHHRDYLNYIVNYWSITEYNIANNYFDKLKSYKSSSLIVLLDIDKTDIFFALTIIFLTKIRILNKKKIIAISVRATELIQKKSIYELIMKKGRIYFLKRYIKGLIFNYIKKNDKIDIYGIFSDSKDKKSLIKFCNYFIHDIQYYDLDILKPKFSKPKEIKVNQISDKLVVFLGSDPKRRNINDLINFFNQKFYFNNLVLIGNISSKKINPKWIHIKRRISNDELFWTIKNAGCVYCFYSNNSPSGFFGRSMQFGTTVIVKKNSYLDLDFYDNKIVISKIADLCDINLKFQREYKKISYNFKRLPIINDI